MTNAVVHFEASGKSAESLREFYGKAFGWQFNVMPEMGYGVVDNGGRGINGGIGGIGDAAGPSAIFYVSVPDPQTTLDKAESLGGRTAMPVMEIPNIVTLAQFTDPEGNLIGIVKDEPGEEAPPSSGAPAENAVTWFEVVGKDGAKLREFYSTLFGWQFNVMPDMDYGMIDHKGNGIDGGVGTSAEPHACWYVEVADPAGHLEKISALGGTVVMPAENMGMVTFGLFKDPEGNLAGVFKNNR